MIDNFPEPWPRFIYPLNHKFQGRDLTGRGSDVTLVGAATYIDVGEADRPAGALMLDENMNNYAMINQPSGKLTFEVRSYVNLQ